VRTSSAEATERAGAELAAELRPGDVVLVKASRSAGLERVAELVTQKVPTQ
jgi:UDP-N-acetylmuramyl pentapeptide synthase